MANKKKGAPQSGKDAVNGDSDKGLLGKLSVKQKKTLVMVLVILAVVVISVLVDNSVRNPPTKSEDDAMNQIFGQNVIANNKEIFYETPVEIITYEPEKINGKQYYRVDVVAGDEPNTKLYGPYYVAANNSKIYLKDTAGQMVPYGV